MAKVDQLIESISSIGGITKLVIASRDGTVLAKEGSKGDQFGSFVTFVAISSDHVKNLMGFTALSHVVLNEAGGDKVLILMGPKVIVGVGLSTALSPSVVIDSLRPVINRTTLD